MKKRDSKKSIGAAIVILLLILGALYFTNFTTLGYMASIKYHGFDEVRENVFIDKDSLESKDDILSMIDNADERLENFFGSLQGKTVIIVTDNKEKLQKLGSSETPALTKTYVFNGAHNYTGVCAGEVTLDILSHELSHAEIHSRLYKNKWSSKDNIPVWFDEGLAMQNDYREKYDENAFEKITDVRDITALKDNEFHDSSKDIRIENYILAKHEVNIWIDTKGKDKVFELIDNINKGKRFEDLYIG